MCACRIFVCPCLVLFLYRPFVHLFKAEIGCHGDRDNCGKGNRQKGEIQLSWDTLRLWGRGERENESESESERAREWEQEDCNNDREWWKHRHNWNHAFLSLLRPSGVNVDKRTSWNHMHMHTDTSPEEAWLGPSLEPVVVSARHDQVSSNMFKQASTIGHNSGTRCLILHLMTGVKRLRSDNIAITSTPSHDNHISVALHCFHALRIILLKPSGRHPSDRENRQPLSYKGSWSSQCLNEWMNAQCGGVKLLLSNLGAGEQQSCSGWFNNLFFLVLIAERLVHFWLRIYWKRKSWNFTRIKCVGCIIM